MTQHSAREIGPGRWHRRVRPWMPVAALLLAAACGGGGGEPPAPPEVRVLAATIGPAGGVLAFPEGRHAGVALIVPAGALAAPTPVTFEADAANPRTLSQFPLYRVEPRGLPLAVPATIRVRIGPGLIDEDGHSDVVCFHEGLSGEAWSGLFDSVVDDDAHTVTATTASFGDFVAWSGSLHRLLTQEFELLDPAVPTAGAVVGGLAITIRNGGFALPIGRGSLASFWSSPASANVVIVPGLLGAPFDFLGLQDLIASLAPSTQNIVLLAYPSGRGVAATANWLYDEIQAKRQPGFGCTILGHSMGGLVGRYLLERSAGDPARAGYAPGDPSLAGTVSHLLLLGVPNAGSDLGGQLVAGLLTSLPPGERHLLQAAHDISYEPDAVPLQMNAAFVDNATRYHVLYGDLGNGSDGVVTVASALAVPLFAPETAVGFAVNHDQLHALAATAGITGAIDALLQAR